MGLPQLPRRTPHALPDERREVRRGDEAGRPCDLSDRLVGVAQKPQCPLQLLGLDERGNAPETRVPEDPVQIRPADLELVTQLLEAHDALRQVRANLPDCVEYEDVPVRTRIPDDRCDKIGQVCQARIVAGCRLIRLVLHKLA